MLSIQCPQNTKHLFEMWPRLINPTEVFFDDLLYLTNKLFDQKSFDMMHLKYWVSKIMSKIEIIMKFHNYETWISQTGSLIIEMQKKIFIKHLLDFWYIEGFQVDLQCVYDRDVLLKIQINIHIVLIPKCNAAIVCIITLICF